MDTVTETVVDSEAVTSTTTPEDKLHKQAKALEKHLSAVISWMNDHCVDNGAGVSSKDIYEGVKASGHELTMSAQSFQVMLSLNVKLGKVPGFVGKRGRSGGYYKVTSGS